MWVTPNNAIDGWAERMQWSDGSIVDYGNWFTGEPNSGGNEDEVEMRMSCDGWACFHGRWNDVDGDTATVRNPKPPALSSLADFLETRWLWCGGRAASLAPSSARPTVPSTLWSTSP